MTFRFSEMIWYSIYYLFFVKLLVSFQMIHYVSSSQIYIMSHNWKKYFKLKDLGVFLKSRLKMINILILK